MRRLRTLRMRLCGFVNRNPGDFETELASHIEMHTDDGLREGLSPEEARRQALLMLGGSEQARQAYSMQQGLPWLETLLSDVRYGLRMMRRNPGFATVAVLSLALGIGATTAMFSLIWAVLLHPFLYADADRIVNPILVDEQHPEAWSWFELNQPLFDALRTAAPVESVLGFNNGHMEVTGGNLPEDVSGVYLTENAGSFFGVRPLLGRNLTPADGENGGHNVVVLSYRFWQLHFGGDLNAVGKILELDHAPYSVVGVMPRRFAFNDTLGGGDVYLPGTLMHGLANLPDFAYLPWIRLRPGVTVSSANAALEPIVRQYAKLHPDRFPDHWRLALQPIIAPYREQSGRSLTLLLLGVVFLLVIGCINCSILLLARGSSRRRELLIRSAIGASRWRIIRQLLIEAVMLSCTGAVLGVAASYWLARLPLQLSPDSFPPGSVIRPNIPVMALSVLLALFCGVLFGLLPALRLSRPGSAGALPNKQPGLVSAPGKHRWSALIAAQVALTLLLLATAGTAIRSFVQLTRVLLGYVPENVIKFGIMLHVHQGDEWNRIQSREARTAYVEQIRQKIASVPGVLTAAVAGNALPPYSGNQSGFELEGSRDRDTLESRLMLTDQRYFQALQIPLLRGRLWTPDENSRGDSVAVVNRSFATRYLASPDTIGGQLRIPDLKPKNKYQVTSPQSTAWRQIIGIVGDARDDGLDRPVVPAIYLPYTTQMMPYLEFHVRTQGAPRSLLHSIQAAVAYVASDQQISNDAVHGTFTLNEAIEHDAQYSRQRLFSVLFGVFSAMALTLALAGIFSVVTYSVAQRTSEFGIRLALGATRNHILWTAVRLTLLSGAIGLVIGLISDALLGRILAQWMKSAFAASSLLVVSVLLTLSAFLACLLPARRAVNIPPATALRCE